jgi:hypothetical protein
MLINDPSNLFPGLGLTDWSSGYWLGFHLVEKWLLKGYLKQETYDIKMVKTVQQIAA